MKIDFLGIPIDALSMKETVDHIDNTIKNKGRINHVVINAGKVVMMQKDKSLYDSVISCDLINADGQSIVWAAAFLGKKLPGRVAGIDLMQELVQLAGERKYKCFFFGAREEVVKKVVEKYTIEYGPEIIAGYRNGYYTGEEEPGIAKMIADSGTRMLFVAMSSPKKEVFLSRYCDILRDVNFAMGVGGSFDVIAGKLRRAPLSLQNIGMEWFYRLLQEPARLWKRYLFGNSKFIWLVLREKFKSK